MFFCLLFYFVRLNIEPIFVWFLQNIFCLYSRQFSGERASSETPVDDILVKKKREKEKEEEEEEEERQLGYVDEEGSLNDLGTKQLDKH
jgi:hypothetical protein